MRRALMLSLFSIAFILSSQTSFASSLSICKMKLKASEDLLTHAERQLGVGEVTRTDVDMAALALLDTEFECRAVFFEAYCKEATALADRIVYGIKAEAAIGQRTQADVIKATAETFRIRGLCL